MNSFESRINLSLPLEAFSEIVCENFNLGKFEDARLIEIGYEDFNYILSASGKKYVVKVFSTFRSLADANMLVERAVTAYENGISCPKLYKANGEYLFITTIDNVKYRMIVMDFIDGSDFYSLGILPNNDEIKVIARELAKLNAIDYRPTFIYDHWAIINFEKEYKENIDLVTGEDRLLIDGVYRSFQSIDLDKLVYGFVHGDIIVTNIIKEKSTNNLFFIDFSVSNYQPRIVDLAVSICDLCLDCKDEKEVKARMNVFLDAYESVSPLTDYEKICLKIFLAAHQAMTVLQTTREKLKENNDSEENEDFLRKGQEGLRMVLTHLI